jgi:dTDP-glucose 4,6-dehydratase
MSKRVLITGASGFLGSHILKYIINNTDWEIVLLTNFMHEGIQDRISFALDDASGRITFIKCDLSSPISSVAAKKIGKIDYVINSASESHVDKSINDPANFIINNVSIICNMLEWAREAKPEKFIQISTDEVYGPYQNRESLEWDAHLPSSPYSASKAAQEDIAFAYWRTYKVPVIITNTMNLIGENQGTEKFTPLVIGKVIREETVDIHTYDNGKIGSRDWIYVGNKASAIVHILNNVEPQLYGKHDKPSRFNVSGKQFSNLEWANLIAKYLNKELKYEFKDANLVRPGYDSEYGIDSSKLFDSGWTPPYDIEESLEKTVKWYLDNQEWL